MHKHYEIVTNTLKGLGMINKGQDKCAFSSVQNMQVFS